MPKQYSAAKGALAPVSKAMPAQPRILIVGNDIGLHAVLTVMLGHEFLVETAISGSEGFDRLGVFLPKLVIVDAQLPDRDGAHFVRALRARSPTCPVLVIRGSDGGEALKELMSLRIDGFFVKPPEFDALVNRIYRLTGTIRSYDQVRFSRSVSRMIEHTKEHYSTNGRLSGLAETIGLSVSHLAYVFRREIGMKPKEFTSRVRMEAAKHLLVTTDDKLETIAQHTGFCDACHFCRVFRQYAGCSPGIYRSRLRTIC